MNDLGKTGKAVIFGACAMILVANTPPIITEPIKTAVSQMRTQYTDVPAYSQPNSVEAKSLDQAAQDSEPANSNFVSRLKSLLK